MVTNYLVTIGGSGARVGEAYVYLAAAGYIDKDTKTKIWIVDKDDKNGNNAELTQTVQNYCNVYNFMKGKERQFFLPEITIELWDFEKLFKNLDKRLDGNCSLISLADGDKNAEIIMRFLHDKESLEAPMTNGFYGRAPTGAAVYDAMTKTKAWADNPLFQDIKDEVEKKNTSDVRIFLVGSSFGATGASILPNLAKSLRKEFKDKVKVAGALLLPYFFFPDANSDDDKAMNVKSQLHPAKAKSALRYYGNDENITFRKTNEELGQEKYTFDALYLLGSQRRTKISNVFSTGSINQRGQLHLVEMIAAMANKHFIDLRADTETPVDATYSFNMTQQGEDYDWNRIGIDIRRAMLTFGAFSVETLTYLYPLIHSDDLITNKEIRKIFGPPWSFLSREKKAVLDESKAKTLVSDMSNFAKKYLGFLLEISTQANGDRPDVQLIDVKYLEGLREKLSEDKDYYRDIVLSTSFNKDMLRDINEGCKPQALTLGNETSCELNAVSNQIGVNVRDIAKKAGGENTSIHTENGIYRVYQVLEDYAKDSYKKMVNE